MIYGNRALEVFNEGVVCKTPKMTIGVFPSMQENFSEVNAYFKVYNRVIYSQADKIARIHFYNANYEYHDNSNVELRWYLNSKEKNTLIELLMKPYTGNDLIEVAKETKVNSVTNWIKAIYEFNQRAKSMNKKFIIPYNLLMPDYTQLPKK